MGAKRAICGTLGGVLALVVGLLLSVDMDPQSHGGEGAPLGSGEMFDAIADHYDSVNKAISLWSDDAWRSALVDALNIQTGDRVLDLATGTADVAIMVAGRGQDVRVVGVDPSERMIGHGRVKVAERGFDGAVELRVGDGQKLEGVGDASFDKASASFGIRNIPDRVAALRE